MKQHVIAMNAGLSEYIKIVAEDAYDHRKATERLKKLDEKAKASLDGSDVAPVDDEPKPDFDAEAPVPDQSEPEEEEDEQEEELNDNEEVQEDKPAPDENAEADSKETPAQQATKSADDGDAFTLDI
jgi:hypothetical protein